MMGLLKQSAWEVGEAYSGAQGAKIVSVSYFDLQDRLQQVALRAW